MKLSSSLKNPLVTGTLILTITGIVSRIIGFLYRIFLSRTIGAEQLGIYQLIFPVFILAISVCTSGIQTGISKIAGESMDSPKENMCILYCGISLSFFLSIIVSFILYKNTDFCAQILLQEPRTEPLLKVVALSIPCCSIHACINGYCYGIKKISVPAISQLLEQLCRFVAVFFIAWLRTKEQRPLDAALPVYGLFIGEATSTLYTLFVLSFQKSLKGFFSSFQKLFALSVPLTLNHIFLHLFQSLEAILIPFSLRAFGYSNSGALSTLGVLNGMVLPFILMPGVFTNSASVMLLPEIAHSKAASRYEKIISILKSSIAFSVILGLCCTLGFLLTGRFIGTYIFHNETAGTYILILSFICPFLYLTTTLASILNGLGKTFVNLCDHLLASGLKLFFILVAVPSFGMRSYLLGMLLSELLLAVLLLISIERYLNQTVG